MALSQQQASKVVQGAIVQSGGFNIEHSADSTLSRAGLKTKHQRESFQRKVSRGVGELGHKVEHVGKIPNQAGTQVQAVVKFVVEKAVVLGGLVIALILGAATPSLAQLTLEPAKDRAEADVFLGGALTSASEASTVYTWDIKLTYPRVFRALDTDQRRWLSTSPIVEFVANKGTDANPD